MRFAYPDTIESTSLAAEQSVSAAPTLILGDRHPLATHRGAAEPSVQNSCVLGQLVEHIANSGAQHDVSTPVAYVHQVRIVVGGCGWEETLQQKQPTIELSRTVFERRLKESLIAALQANCERPIWKPAKTPSLASQTDDFDGMTGL